MSDLTPFNQKDQGLAPISFFDVFNQVESMMLNTFQSAFAPMNNTSFTDQGSEYIFTLTLPNLKREDIQLAIEDQDLILSIRQVVQSESGTGQAFQSSAFSQKFNLHDVDADKITANLNNETLTIILPKKEAVVVNRRVINIL